MRSGTRAARSSAIWVSAASGVAFAAVAVSVQADLTTRWDTFTRNLFRPHDVWGPTQLRADVIVEGLRPPNLALALAVMTLVVCVFRRSLRPAVVVAGTDIVASILSLAAKWLMARPDPHGDAGGHGGSFPSGHVVAVVVSFGLVMLLLRPVPRWWQWLVPALLGIVMALANLLQAAHWASDLLGGGLLGVAVLGLAVSLGCGPWAAGRPGRPAGPSRKPAPVHLLRDASPAGVARPKEP